MQEHHIALYRKYRPQTFSDVVGQEQIVELLESTIKQKKISHAYLFCGGRGTGKTTVARIFAHDIGCNPEDIIEIDAASNRGIDEIRELREAVRTAPFSSPYKIYIVDEAHMLTKEAANALLKTLEEPPTHVIFILATTDPEKLPSTIISRCQKLVFKSPDIVTLAKRLTYVAKEEGKDIDEATAELIATHGKGSYRDALGVLEQILTTSGKKITHDTVLAFLGVTDKEILLQLLTAMCKKDTASLSKSFTTLESSSAVPLKAYDDITEMVRVGLLARIGEKYESTGISQAMTSSIASLAKEYPYVVSSKTILELLTYRHLLEVSALSAWTAFEAVMVGLVEGGEK
jgi:DNA polymerase-3 subunit gamma/tau